MSRRVISKPKHRVLHLNAPLDLGGIHHRYHGGKIKKLLVVRPNYNPHQGSRRDNPFPEVPLPEPPVDEKGELELPPEIDKIFCVSIKPHRWEAFLQRAGPWGKFVEKLDGTNGHTLDRQRWQREGFVANQWLSRGQLGCYDSHVRAWEAMARNPEWTTMLIMEDDADFTYCPNRAAILRRAFDEANQKVPDWDIFYLGRNSMEPNNFTWVDRHIISPRGCQTFHAYVISRHACKVLLENAWPANRAVDVLASDLSDSGQIKALAIEESAIRSLYFGSDTMSIR